MEEVGFIVPTYVQQQALPVLFAGRDCILHAQVILWSLNDLAFQRLIFSISLDDFVG